jgi:pantetheine-phosphate adenylyltransferase
VPQLNTPKFDYFGNYGALGGTFDHLHPGHKILLSISALAPSNELFCGVMAPSTLKSKTFGDLLESIDTRVENVAKFLKFFNWALNVEVNTNSYQLIFY